jgi:hypothetical protein
MPQRLLARPHRPSTTSHPARAHEGVMREEFVVAAVQSRQTGPHGRARGMDLELNPKYSLVNLPILVGSPAVSCSVPCSSTVRVGCKAVVARRGQEGGGPGSPEPHASTAAAKQRGPHTAQRSLPMSRSGNTLKIGSSSGGDAGRQTLITTGCVPGAYLNRCVCVHVWDIWHGADMRSDVSVNVDGAS